MLNPKYDTLSQKQFCFLVFITGVAAKLFSLPAELLKSGGRSAVLAFAVFLAIDLLAFGLFLTASRLSPDRTAFELLEERPGKIGAKIVFMLAAAYLLLKTLSSVFNIAGFIGTEILAGVPPAVILLPLAMLLAVIGAGRLRALGRAAEIFIYFILTALICLLLLAGKNADITALLPVSAQGMSVPLTRFPFAFGDFTALYLTLGQIKRKKAFSAVSVGSAVLSMVAAAAFLLLTGAALVYVKDITSPADAVTAVTRASVSRLALGRFDKIAFIVFAAAPVLTAGLFFHSAVRSAAYTAGIQKHPALLSFILAAAVFLTALLWGSAGFSAFTGVAGIYFAFAFSVGLPLLLLILTLIKSKKPAAEANPEPAAAQNGGGA